MEPMQSVPEQFESALDRAEFRRAPHRAGVELYRAHIVRHAFEPHTHEAFGLGSIEAGTERFRYRGADHLAPRGSLVMMNPDELHTGRAETAAGWRYRMLYIERGAIERVSGESGWHFGDAVRDRAANARRVGVLLDQLWRATEPLAFDGLLQLLLEEFRNHARSPRAAKPESPARFSGVIDYLRTHLARRITLDELADVAGLSPFHFLRSFKAQYHATPQKMLMALRLYEAKRLLAADTAPAQVAAATGLVDQAHLTHAFLCRYGVTPARYRQQVHS
jgi:AraC-like DNA-binding protein